MKKLSFLSVVVLICSVFSINAQNTEIEKRCYTMEYLEQQKKLDPTLESRMQALEVATQEWIKNNKEQIENSKTVITIPVVIHIIYANDSTNISDARVNSQITILNTDFAGLSTQLMSPFAANLKANTEIQFCLAKRDPSGKTTTGIERRTGAGVPASFNINPIDNNMKHQATGGLDQWDPKKYMNIWVCNFIGAMGYAEFPTPALSTNFGVAIKYKFFGNNPAANPNGLGRTTTHEISHCFNLKHIWGDNTPNCTDTDYCDDTPNQYNYTNGTLSGVKTDACTTTSPGIMWMNFMDYSRDIYMANFTPNQKARMQAQFASGQPLYFLTTSNGCTPVGIEENNFIQNVSIYPNPTNGELNINFSIANPCDVNVSIHNILGEEIYSFNKNKTSVVNTNVDISNNASGIYFVKIKTEKQILTQKISLLK